ncbi:MAG: hypothetical protein PHH93_04255 [Prolixibacteraceae bacterium]|nr:hypothetical protein [Prolixibacteraceae bacterium]
MKLTDTNTESNLYKISHILQSSPTIIDLDTKIMRARIVPAMVRQSNPDDR